MKYAVKYCGGCNSRHDRTEAVRQIEAQLGEKLSAARAQVHYDELFVVCGCPARCAGLDGLFADKIIIIDKAF